MSKPIPGAIFKNMPILKTENMPECPGCKEYQTFVVQGDHGPSLAGCLACGKQWKVPKIIPKIDHLMDHTEFWREVGRRVKAARKRFGINQAELARALGYSRTSVVNLEAGRQQMNPFKLYQAACLLGCRLHDIIPDDSTEETQ